ncbi:MAG: ATP-binding cassette domain-containing protein, partial [candidate division WOR-3 bacterium]
RFGAFADNSELLSRLGFVFQGGALFDSLSVYDNVAFPLRESLRMTEAELDRRVNEVLDRVGMLDNAALLPGALSGGMTRLVAIARALACNPDYVFFDEPTTGLDPVMRSRIIELVLSLRDREAKTEVAVTHDLGAAEQMADIIYMLRDSRIAVLDSARKEHYEAQSA